MPNPNSLANLLPPWKAGDIPNPAGRPKNLGSTVREMLTQLGKINPDGTAAYDQDELHRIAADKRAAIPKRLAAKRLLMAMETGDLADFAGLLRGENRLEDLRAMGIDTGVIKRIKQKTRKLPKGEELVEREIELHDRSGTDFDRVINHTDGSPTQTINHSGAVGLPIPVIVIEMAHPMADMLADGNHPGAPKPVISTMVNTLSVDAPAIPDTAIPDTEHTEQPAPLPASPPPTDPTPPASPQDG